MTRDMNYWRDLMLQIEAAPAHQPWSKSFAARVPDHEEAIEYLNLLLDAGLIRVRFHNHIHGGEMWDGVNLTAAGHDFLDNIRDETVWMKTKERVAVVGGKASIQVISEVAAGLVRSFLNLP